MRQWSVECNGKRIRWSFACLVFLFVVIAALPPIAIAADPPSITSFNFDVTTQQISFFANTGGAGKTMHFTISSSSAQTTFSAPQSGVITGAVGGGTSWTITPGGAPVGETHTFTIAVSNENGTDQKNKCLKVSAGKSVTGDYAFCVDQSPSISTWGAVTLAALILMAAMLYLRRRNSVVPLAS